MVFAGLLKDASQVQANAFEVFAGLSLATTCESLRAEEIVISSSKIAGRRIDEIIRTCDAIGIPLRQMQIQRRAEPVSVPAPRVPVRGRVTVG